MARPPELADSRSGSEHRAGVTRPCTRLGKPWIRRKPSASVWLYEPPPSIVAMPSSYRLFGLVRLSTMMLPLYRLSRTSPVVCLLRLANERQQGVHLGRVPVAVIHHLGDFRRQPIAQVHQVPVHRQLLDAHQRVVQDRHARRLVHAAALHAHEPVLHHVDAADPVAAADLVELLAPSANGASRWPLTLTGTPASKPTVTCSTLSGACCGETVMPNSTVLTPLTVRSSSLPAS